MMSANEGGGAGWTGSISMCASFRMFQQATTHQLLVQDFSKTHRTPFVHLGGHGRAESVGRMFGSVGPEAS